VLVDIAAKFCPQCASPQQHQVPQQVTPHASISVSDSMVHGAVSQTTQHTESIGSQSMQIQDTVVMGDVVQNTYVTQTVNQEMMNYVVAELQNLRLNVDSLRIGLDSNKKAQIKDKNTVNRIAQLNETVMNAELASGTSMLDKETYEMLSTVALSANADGAGYMTHSYGLRVENLEEKVKLAKRKSRLGMWCLQVATHRMPEGFKNYIEAAEIYLETRDNRILSALSFQQCTKVQWPINRWFMPINIWLTKVFMGFLVRRYELKASKDPTVPNWSELGALRAKALNIHLQVKSARKQPRLLTA